MNAPIPMPARAVRFLPVALASALGACAGPQVSEYAAEQPVFDIRSYFNGPIEAFGVVMDRSGRVTRRFTVHMECDWKGDQGRLDERFDYSDGRQQRRVWQLRRQADGSYVGTAGDVIGEARGWGAGNAFNLRYTLAVPVDDRVWNLKFDDWLFRVDEHRVINRAVISKFGFQVGEVLVSFTRG